MQVPRLSKHRETLINNFCQRVSELTGGLITTDCVDEHEDDVAPSTSQQVHKRSSSSLPSEPVKKAKQIAAERKDKVEREINENEIGINNMF